MKIKKQKFGCLSDGTKIHLYTLKNDKMSVSISDYGCTITSIVLIDNNGLKKDIVLGFSTLEGYVNTRLCFGSIVGPVANRIGGASFLLNGKKYDLEQNDGDNTLHSGSVSFDKIVWKSQVIEEKDFIGIKFTYFSVDGEFGFPGNVNVSVTYLLDNNNNLICLYDCKTDKATPINITNHSYFNLDGTGTVENHLLKLNSNKVLEIDNNLIPTGKILDVKDTVFDFNEEKEIGVGINNIKPGYDHCFVTDMYNNENKQCGVPLNDDKLIHFATLKNSKKNTEMNVYTNMEGCQVYTANWIQDVVGKNGIKYKNHDGICFETQCFPDSPNKKEFPTCVLEPGQTLKAKTIFSFKF